MAEISYFYNAMYSAERLGTNPHIRLVYNPINISVKVVNDTRALMRAISLVCCLSCVVTETVTSSVKREVGGSNPSLGV